MELKDKYKLLLNIFEAKESESFSDTISRVLFSPNRNAFFEKYKELFPDLNEDELRSCWQFWHADSEEKKQYYTSTPLATLCAKLLVKDGGNVLYDCCAGSGTLSVAVWSQNNGITIICEELDGEVIPLLLFNLAVRNIPGEVRNGNALTGETERAWRLNRCQSYSSIEEMMFVPDYPIKADIAISNPPFNIRMDGKKQNFSFCERCLQVAEKAVVILPAGSTTSNDEAECRKSLIERHKVISCIQMPSGLFESTGVVTAIYFLGNNNINGAVSLVDATKVGSTYIREQRGEGSKSHTERIYKKEMVTFTDVQMDAICTMTQHESEVSKIVSVEELAEKKYSLQFGNYKIISPDEGNTLHRDFNDIINDINKINRIRNTLKVTINKVWAEQLGLKIILDLSNENKEVTAKINDSLSKLGIKEKIVEADYIAQTNSKELKIVQMDKEMLSPVFESFLMLWRQHITTMNNMENLYLAELRDSLLEPLMTGRLSFEE